MNDGPPRGRRSPRRGRGPTIFATIPAIAAALLLACALAATAATPWGRDLLAEFARTSAPERALGSPRLRAALVRERILAPQPQVDAGGGDGWSCPEIELGPVPVRPEGAPSTLAAPPDAARRGRPFLSLWLDPCRSARLHGRSWARGRDTEEIGWVSLFDDGRLLFSTAVGVRIHGGISRKDPPYSYRLYFRDAYGLSGIPAELLPPAPGTTISRLIVAELDDRDRDGSPWPFPGDVAFGIGRRLGAEVPASRAIWFAINGDTPRPVSAIEHLGPDYFRRQFGHDGFDFVRGKRESGDPAEATFRAELDWIASRPAPLLAAEAATRYDLDSLLSWLVTVVYCGTGDLYQDAMVRDRTGATRGGRWFWIHWDHDMSFRSPPNNSRFGRFEDAFYAVVWSQRETDLSPARSLLVRLLTEDAEFRDGVRDRFEQALDRELTPEFLEELIARTEREARDVGFTDLHFAGLLREYFVERPQQVRDQVDEVLAAAADPDITRPPGLVRHRGRAVSRNP